MKRMFGIAWSLGLMVVACATNGGTATSEGAGPAQPQIVIEGRAFVGETEIAAGTAVAVVNNDGVRHSVTSKEAGLFEVIVDGGGTGELTIDAPGTYDFFCKFHSSMTAQIVVI